MNFIMNKLYCVLSILQIQYPFILTTLLPEVCYMPFWRDRAKIRSIVLKCRIEVLSSGDIWISKI